MFFHPNKPQSDPKKPKNIITTSISNRFKSLIQTYFFIEKSMYIQNSFSNYVSTVITYIQNVIVFLNLVFGNWQAMRFGNRTSLSMNTELYFDEHYYRFCCIVQKRSKKGKKLHISSSNWKNSNDVKRISKLALNAVIVWEFQDAIACYHTECTQLKRAANIKASELILTSDVEHNVRRDVTRIVHSIVASNSAMLFKECEFIAHSHIQHNMDYSNKAAATHLSLVIRNARVWLPFHFQPIFSLIVFSCLASL